MKSTDMELVSVKNPFEVDKEEAFQEYDKEAATVTVERNETIDEFAAIDERKFLVKVDFCILTFVCLQFWLIYVDGTGFVNAYITGLKESLHLHGKDFNYIHACFSAGYIVSMIPHNLILLKVQPRIWMSFCILAWGLLNFATFKIPNYSSLCVLRFFQGIFEGCCFTGTHLILGSWYKESELPFRSAIFTCSGLIGSMFSGFMQVAIFKSLDGACGLEGWRWVFIIDFIITIPIAIYALLIFCNPPNVKYVGNFKYLDKISLVNKIFSKEELEYASKRLPPRTKTATELDWSVFKRVLGGWHWWLFSLVWALGGLNISFSSNGTFQLWLSHMGYSVSNRNHYPIGIYGVGIVMTLLTSVYLAQFKNKQVHLAIFISIVMIIVASLIKTHPLEPKFFFTAEYLGGIIYSGQAIFFSWANVICANDLQERAIVLASMNMFSGAVHAWWSIVFYPATDVPKYTKGCYAMYGTTIATIVVSVVIYLLHKRDTTRMKHFL